MDYTLITVIVPIYKVELYIKDCIDSILNQTYGNLEIILVDDGSPDSCGRICDQYAIEDDRIQVIHKNNGGLSSARNAGLDIATGHYIAFIDSDDIIHPQYFEILHGFINDADYIFCDLYEFQNKKDITITPISDPRVEELSSTKMLNELMSFHYPNSIIACNKLYKSELWKQIRYPIGKIHEDEFIIHELLDKSEFIKFIDLKIYYYRQSQTSIMAFATNDKAILDKIEGFWLRRSYYISKNITAPIKHLNTYILHRCLMQVVKSDNKIWQSIDLKMIFFENNLPLSYKILLLFKKKYYKIYVFMQKTVKSLRFNKK